MTSQSSRHHVQVRGDSGDVIGDTTDASDATVAADAAPPAVSSAPPPSEPHLPPAVSPNVASVVPAIPSIEPAIPIAQAAANSLFDPDPFAVDHHNPHHHTDSHDHANNPKDNTATNNNNGDAVGAEHGDHNNGINNNEPTNPTQRVEINAFPQEQHQGDVRNDDNNVAFSDAGQHQEDVRNNDNNAAFNDALEPQHQDSEMQDAPVSIVTSMPVVTQEMNPMSVSLSGTAEQDNGAVAMVTVATSESVGIPATVSGAMSTDVYTSAAASVVVSAAQLTGSNNQPFSGMEYMANPTTDQPHQQLGQIAVDTADHPTASPPSPTAGNTGVPQSFAMDTNTPVPKFQDEVVSVVAPLAGSEGVNVHAPVVNTVPVVTPANNNTAQPPVVPVVMPNNAVNVGATIANPAEIPYGGETVDKCVECEVCGSLFGDAGSLKRHAARAHKAATGKGPVFCSHCSASLKNEQNLRRHIAVCHSGSQENRCNMCSASFSSRGSLRIHQQTVHSVPPAAKSGGRNSNSNPKGRPKGIAKPKAEKSYLCDMCTDTFKWKGNLKRHRELRHLQLRPFQCHICNASFGTKSNMRVHLITHSNNATNPSPK